MRECPRRGEGRGTEVGTPGVLHEETSKGPPSLLVPPGAQRIGRLLLHVGIFVVEQGNRALTQGRMVVEEVSAYAQRIAPHAGV